MLGAGYPTLVPHWTRSFPMPTRLTSRNMRNLKGRKVSRSRPPVPILRPSLFPGKLTRRRAPFRCGEKMVQQVVNVSGSRTAFGDTTALKRKVWY